MRSLSPFRDVKGTLRQYAKSLQPALDITTGHEKHVRSLKFLSNYECQDSNK